MSCIVVRWKPSRAKQRIAAFTIWRRLASTCSGVTCGMTLQYYLTENVHFSITNFHLSIPNEGSASSRGLVMDGVTPLDPPRNEARRRDLAQPRTGDRRELASTGIAISTVGRHRRSVERPGCVVHFWLEGPEDAPLVVL